MRAQRRLPSAFKIVRLLSRLGLAALKATLTSKGQITIPRDVRRRLGLEAGNVLEIQVSVPDVKTKPTIDPKVWEEFGKKATNPWPELSSAQIIDEMRGPHWNSLSLKACLDEDSSGCFGTLEHHRSRT